MVEGHFPSQKEVHREQASCSPCDGAPQPVVPGWGWVVNRAGLRFSVHAVRS